MFLHKILMLLHSLFFTQAWRNPFYSWCCEAWLFSALVYKGFYYKCLPKPLCSPIWLIFNGAFLEIQVTPQRLPEWVEIKNALSQDGCSPATLSPRVCRAWLFACRSLQPVHRVLAAFPGVLCCCSFLPCSLSLASSLLTKGCVLCCFFLLFPLYCSGWTSFVEWVL